MLPVSFVSLAIAALVVAFPAPASAHFVGYKSPNPGMHFTQGQPLVIFADIFDSREGKGFIVCPNGQTVSNYSPPPDYSDPPRVATCSGGGTPTGWPQFQILIDGAVQTDMGANKQTIPNTIAFDHNGNPSPIGFFRFVAPTAGLSPGPHMVVVRGMFSNDAVNVVNQDSLPLTVTIDAPPAKTMMTLSANVNGAVNWDNVIVVGNGKSVTASGALVIRNSLVTGVAGITGTVSSATVEGSIFEDTGAMSLTLGSGTASIKNNEWRANNRLTFVADDPSVPFIASFNGSGTAMKVFQGNRVGAGQTKFDGSSWLVGGDTDDASNVFIGPRTIVNIIGANTTVRGNFSHHNYRGAWSQGYNFYYYQAKSGILTEHNFIRDGSWPLQYLTGEFRYNVVFGYGHTWMRTATSNTSIHHNLFVPGGDGSLDAGLQCYGGESGLLIYNNTFDGGGMNAGDFANSTVDMTGGSKVASLRNNLVTYARNQSGGAAGEDRITGGASSYTYADYNAFYSPDASNKMNYDFSGAGSHDAKDTADGQLSSNPFAGQRIAINNHDDRLIDPVIDEGAVWQGTQKVSQVLALFRDRYKPAASSKIIDAGDPQDNDSMGRRVDIGAIDLVGHDQDKLGKFGTPPSETVPPTVSLTAPTSGAMLTGNTTLSATAMDNAGGSGVVLVQFLVDGNQVAQVAASPYSADFNTAILTNGQHSFTAKAWDAAGNSAVSAAVMASTMNAMVVQPAGTGGSGTGAGGAGTGTGGSGTGAGGSTGAGNSTGTGTGLTGGSGTGNSGLTGGPGAGGTTGERGVSGGCACSVPDAGRGATLLLPFAAAWMALALRRGRQRGER
ncbi:MAG TPA: Ig-like domain-containing protein [Polyangia bacterium]